MSHQPAAHAAIQSEPPRIKKFRLGLVQAIPRFPNDRASLKHLQQKGLRDLLVDFVNWRARYVGTRPRTVIAESAATSDQRWTLLSAGIETFLEKVRKGEDLTPHLSLEPHTRGFTPAALAPGASSEDKWSDKDFLLATQGFHHFHLGINLEAAGHVRRTDDLLFAHVTRDTFTVIAIFDHGVFDLSSAERHRLWVVHDQYVFRDLPPGSVVIGASIATSGHSTHCVLYANKCARTIASIDPRLDNRSYVEELYGHTGQAAPGKPKFAWCFNHLDLGVGETRTSTFFTLLRAWN